MAFLSVQQVFPQAIARLRKEIARELPLVGQAILINVSPSLRTSKGNAETKGSLKSTFSLTLNGEDWSNFGVLPPPERKARFHYVTEDNIIFDNRTDSVPPWPFPTTTVS